MESGEVALEEPQPRPTHREKGRGNYRDPHRVGQHPRMDEEPAPVDGGRRDRRPGERQGRGQRLVADWVVAWVLVAIGHPGRRKDGGAAELKGGIAVEASDRRRPAGLNIEVDRIGEGQCLDLDDHPSAARCATESKPGRQAALAVGQAPAIVEGLTTRSEVQDAEAPSGVRNGVDRDGNGRGRPAARSGDPHVQRTRKECGDSIGLLSTDDGQRRLP